MKPDAFHLTPEQERRVDLQVDSGNMSYAEALEHELGSAKGALGSRALKEVALKSSENVGQSQKAKRRPSRRGGRSFPEPSDSSLDPYWN